MVGSPNRQLASPPHAPHGHTAIHPQAHTDGLVGRSSTVIQSLQKGGFPKACTLERIRKTGTHQEDQNRRLR
ncbi:unnamed protein product, partial [Rangifer tarandus platyrhynchus]